MKVSELSFNESFSRSPVGVTEKFQPTGGGIEPGTFTPTRLEGPVALLLKEFTIYSTSSLNWFIYLRDIRHLLVLLEFPFMYLGQC